METSKLNIEDLSELVYEICADGATDEMNKTNDEDKQEDILSLSESEASDINNQGLDGQVSFLKRCGISEERMISACID
jgi:hypothetical protein